MTHRWVILVVLYHHLVYNWGVPYKWADLVFFNFLSCLNCFCFYVCFGSELSLIGRNKWEKWERAKTVVWKNCHCMLQYRKYWTSFVCFWSQKASLFCVCKGDIQFLEQSLFWSVVYPCVYPCGDRAYPNGGDESSLMASLFRPKWDWSCLGQGPLPLLSSLHFQDYPSLV